MPILAGPSKNGKKKPESSTSNGKPAYSIPNQSIHNNKQWIELLESIQTMEIIAEDTLMDQDAAPPLKEEMPWMLMPQKLAEAYNIPKQRKTS